MKLAANDLTVGRRLSGLGAELRQGEITAICGPNGAGKSTLLSCLAGLVEPDVGAVTLDGVPVRTLEPEWRARTIGYLPQSPEVAWDVSVEVLVSLGRLPWRGAPESEAEMAIDQAISEMDLEVLRHRPVSQLSGGERARALMARVLATQPQWVLADEPLANLDLGHAASLVSCFRRQADEGRGVVLVMHDLASAMNHADRVLVLDRGELVADDGLEQALSEDVISRVWGVKARWLGDAGKRALSVGQGQDPVIPSGR